jgi:hypothetical protein
MLFISACGGMDITFAEIVANVPTVQFKVNSGFPTKAACLASKRSLDVMSAEVNIVYEVFSKRVVPIQRPSLLGLHQHERAVPTDEALNTAPPDIERSAESAGYQKRATPKTL